MAETTAPERSEIAGRARRVLWACGLCFGLLFLMGLSGVASITLLYDDPLYRTGTQGFEGVVVRTVSSLSGVIKALHSWGGYVGIVLAGWAGLEVFSFGRLIKRSEEGEWRATGRRLMPLGLAGAAMLIVALILLIPSGVAAKSFLSHDEPKVVDDTPNPGAFAPRISGRAELENGADSKFVEWHTRELNYVLALGALLLVFAASSTRKVELAAKKPPESSD
ncbi:MAG: hypothetical protein H6839_05975 [Planctomycetes bacterium]|nr:hypothetical protein [Planctomycetota bacterium]